MAYKKPKGTVDFYPEDFKTKEFIFDSIRQQAINYNFKEIESPAFENLDLLTKKEGEEIKTQIFTLDKRGDEKFGLRFDLTVPTARLFIEKQKEMQKPVKWFTISRMWRYEKPQAGRLREFYQASFELFGSNKPEADAEIIKLAIDCLTSLGLTKKDFFIKLNNRQLLEGLLQDIADKKNIPELIKIIDKKDKMTEEEFNSEVKKLKIDPVKINDILRSDIKDLKKLNQLAQQGFDELSSILRLLKNKKEFIKIDLSTARGLAYYTGNVFEIFDTKQEYRALAGGGRYDKMVELFGGQPTPATGFAIGYATLSLLLKDKGTIPKADLAPDYLIVTINEEVKEKAMEIADKLRKTNIVEIDLMQRNIGNQFKYAGSIKAKKVIILGPDELKQDKVKIKDMKTGKEESVLISKL
ncbi:MAG: histidine--tRNA ligase [Nanoarchaeota archaeon]